MYRLLHIGANRCNYPSGYQATYAADFTQARLLIAQAEAEGTPYDALDIPKKPFTSGISDDIRSGEDRGFWDFLDWMERREWKIPFSVYGIVDTKQFVDLREHCRARGFRFLD